MLVVWRSRWDRIKNWRWQADRPYRLIAFAMLPLAIVAILEPLFASPSMQWLRDLISRSSIFGPLIFPVDGIIEWKDRLQGILLLLGLPVAFCLWHWRDRNVRDQIEEQRKQVENARKDINLKEFQEVQLRAAGALDEKLPAEAREQLRIAALHQLRGFLRGEYGESFRRPAFELLLAGHAAAIRRIGLHEAIDDSLASKPGSDTIRSKVAEALSSASARLTAVDRARLAIMSHEWKYIFRADWPLNGRIFDLINLSGNSLAEQLDLNQSSFCGAVLPGIQLKGVNLNWSRLQGARFAYSNFEPAEFGIANLEGGKLWGARLQGADLRKANLRGSHLLMARLEGTDLGGAHLEGAFLRLAQLEGTDLDRAHLEGANLDTVKPAILGSCNLSRYDDKTMFVLRKGDPAAEVVREQWRAKGARHVDELKDDE